MGLIKIFSGSEILALSLKDKIEATGVDVVVKDNIQSGRLAGFGTTDQAVELFIQENSYGKIHAVIEDFRLNL